MGCPGELGAEHTGQRRTQLQAWTELPGDSLVETQPAKVLRDVEAFLVQVLIWEQQGCSNSQLFQAEAATVAILWNYLYTHRPVYFPLQIILRLLDVKAVIKQHFLVDTV